MCVLRKNAIATAADVPQRWRPLQEPSFQVPRGFARRAELGLAHEHTVKPTRSHSSSQETTVPSATIISSTLSACGLTVTLHAARTSVLDNRPDPDQHSGYLWLGADIATLPKPWSMGPWERGGYRENTRSGRGPYVRDHEEHTRGVHAAR